MATFSAARCGAANQNYTYWFHFQNQSTTTTICYYLGATFSPQPQFPGTPLNLEANSGFSMQLVLVPPGQTSSCNFTANGQLQAGQPPFLGVLGPDNKTVITTLCARFWTGQGSIGSIIGATEDALKAGVELVQSAAEAEEDPYAAIMSAFNAAKDVAQACGTLASNEDQYINFIVTPQSGSYGWTLAPGGNTPTAEVATNSVNGINMTVRVDGGGVSNPTTQNIYFYYSDNAS